MGDILQRQKLLIGEDANQKLISTNIAVFGCGGVGGFALESLTRNGIKNLFICDKDTIDITNLNRQIIATLETVGEYKVDAFEKRIKSINPDINLITSKETVSKDNIKEVLGDFKPEYIVDAIDDVEAKIDLAEYANENGIKIISSMGAGNRTRPEKLIITKLKKTYNCKMSKKFKKLAKGRNVGNINVVHSTELAKKTGSTTIATISEVPATAGILAVSWIINDILENL